MEMSKSIPDVLTQKYIDSDGIEQYKEWKTGWYIGKGSYSKCYLITNDDGVNFAGKFVAKKNMTLKKHKARLRTEIQIHK